MATNGKYLPAEERRAVIVETVLTLASEGNPSEITTAAIAERMGLTQGALFRHFPNKDAIWEAVMAWAARNLASRLEAAAMDAPTSLDALEAVFFAHIGFIAEYPGVPGIFFSELQRPWLRLQSVDPIYGAAVGGLLVGVGLLILIRHRGSLGGFGILALYLQDRLGFRAGWVQLALDAGVLTLSLLSIPPVIVAISLIGALTLNLTLANNHRPGRYVGM